MKKTQKRSSKSGRRKSKRGGHGPAEAVPEPDAYHLAKINRINGFDIYKFTINGCVHYLYNNFNALHVYITTEPPTILDFGNTKLSDANKEEILAFMKEDHGSITIRRELLKYGVAYYDPPFYCFQPLNLSNAQTQIRELNELIPRQCGFQLSLDYIYESKSSNMSIFSSVRPTELVLCLTLGDQCISSILLEVNSKYIIISSKTKEGYEGKKYNTLLRCVVMIIAQSLSPTITSVLSVAINPISAYLLVQKFNGIIQDEEFDEVIKQTGLPSDADVRSKIDAYKTHKELTGEMFGLEIHCQLNDDTIHDNKTLFPVYLGNSCT